MDIQILFLCQMDWSVTKQNYMRANETHDSMWDLCLCQDDSARSFMLQAKLIKDEYMWKKSAATV